MGARNSERSCTSLSPVARFSILTRSHQRELRPTLKEQLRGCPSSVLKNLTKFQSWTSLLSAGNMNARSSLIRSACCIFSFASYEHANSILCASPPTSGCGLGIRDPSRAKSAYLGRSGRGLPAAVGPEETEVESWRKLLCAGSRAARPPAGLLAPPARRPPALQQAAAPRSRPGRRRADTPALGERRTPPGQPRTTEGRSARPGRARGRRVQRGAGVSRTRCRRGRRSSVPAPAVRPTEGERRLGGPGAGRERRGRDQGRGLGASGLRGWGRVTTGGSGWESGAGPGEGPIAPGIRTPGARGACVSGCCGGLALPHG